jgi:hypothetical protein
METEALFTVQQVAATAFMLYLCMLRRKRMLVFASTSGCDMANLEIQLPSPST